MSRRGRGARVALRHRHLVLISFQPRPTRVQKERMTTALCPAYAPFFGFAGVGAAVRPPPLTLPLRLPLISPPSPAPPRPLPVPYTLALLLADPSPPPPLSPTAADDLLKFVPLAPSRTYPSRLNSFLLPPSSNRSSLRNCKGWYRNHGNGNPQARVDHEGAFLLLVVRGCRRRRRWESRRRRRT